MEAANAIGNTLTEAMNKEPNRELPENVVELFGN